MYNFQNYLGLVGKKGSISKSLIVSYLKNLEKNLNLRQNYILKHKFNLNDLVIKKNNLEQQLITIDCVKNKEILTNSQLELGKSLILNLKQGTKIQLDQLKKSTKNELREIKSNIDYITMFTYDYNFFIKKSEFQQNLKKKKEPVNSSFNVFLLTLNFLVNF
jgi:hypothetical protein